MYICAFYHHHRFITRKESDCPLKGHLLVGPQMDEKRQLMIQILWCRVGKEKWKWMVEVESCTDSLCKHLPGAMCSWLLVIAFLLPNRDSLTFLQLGVLDRFGETCVALLW